MALLDHIQNAVEKVIPSKSSNNLPTPVSSRGIGSRRGMASFEDEVRTLSVISSLLFSFILFSGTLVNMKFCCYFTATLSVLFVFLVRASRVTQNAPVVQRSTFRSSYQQTNFSCMNVQSGLAFIHSSLITCCIDTLVMGSFIFYQRVLCQIYWYTFGLNKNRWSYLNPQLYFIHRKYSSTSSLCAVSPVSRVSKLTGAWVPVSCFSLFISHKLKADN